MISSTVVRSLYTGMTTESSGLAGSGAGRAVDIDAETVPQPRGPESQVTARLLIFAPNWLGDAVMALPAIVDVRRACRMRRSTWRPDPRSRHSSRWCRRSAVSSTLEKSDRHADRLASSALRSRAAPAEFVQHGAIGLARRHSRAMGIPSRFSNAAAHAGCVAADARAPDRVLSASCACARVWRNVDDRAATRAVRQPPRSRCGAARRAGMGSAHAARRRGARCGVWRRETVAGRDRLRPHRRIDERRACDRS